MDYISPAEVNIPADRLRKGVDQEHVAELAESFSRVGQLQPIVINREDNRLLAGLHRIEAAKLLGWDVIGFVYKDQLTPTQQLLVELDENRRRRQLTWQEESSAVARLHELLVEEAKKAEVVAPWTLEKTAKELGVSETTVVHDVQLSRYLSNPRVAAQNSRQSAIQTMKRERELRILRELARRHSSAASPDDDLAGGALYLGDCSVVMKSFSDESVDLIITDPPWGVNLYGVTPHSKIRGRPTTFDDSTNPFQLAIAKEVFRVLRPGGHIYLFFPSNTLAEHVDILTEAGFSVRTRPLIWFKSDRPSVTAAYTQFMPSYESILWGYKPDSQGVARPLAVPTPDALAFPHPHLGFHDTEKPVELLQRWIETSSLTGELVLDCFAGSGSTLVAAFSLGRRYVGIEKDVAMHQKCFQRLKDLERGTQS